MRASDAVLGGVGLQLAPIGLSTSVLCAGGSELGRRAPSSELEVATLKENDASEAQQQVVAQPDASQHNTAHRLRLFAKGVGGPAALKQQRAARQRVRSHSREQLTSSERLNGRSRMNRSGDARR